MENRKKDGINSWCNCLMPFVRTDEFGNLYVQKKGNPHEFIEEKDSRFGHCIYEYIEGFDIKNLPNLLNNIKVRLPDNPPLLGLDNDQVALSNGMFNIRTSEFISYEKSSYDWTLKINVPYVENAYSEVVDKFLDDLSNDNPAIKRILLLPYVYAIFPSLRYLPLIFFIVGDGANGKSVYTRLGEHLIGEQRSFCIEPQLFANRFAASCLVGKRYAYGADIPDTFLDSAACAKLKMISGGDNFFIESKGKDGESYKGIKPVLLFACNKMPEVEDKSSGFCRRLVVIEARKSHTEAKKNCDPHMFEKLTTPESLQYLLRLALQVAMEIRKSGCIDLPESILRRQLEMQKSAVSVVKTFLEACPPENFDLVKAHQAYNEFIEWCCREKKVPVRNNVFGKLLCRYGQLEVHVIRERGGGSYRLYYLKSGRK